MALSISKRGIKMLSIYNKISEYITVVNLEGEIIFCNESFLKRFNYKKDEILNKDIRKIINKFNYILYGLSSFFLPIITILFWLLKFSILIFELTLITSFDFV